MDTLPFAQVVCAKHAILAWLPEGHELECIRIAGSKTVGCLSRQ
jgi:hypothetical protein